MKKDQDQGTTTKANAASPGLRPDASARSQGTQASSGRSGRQSSQEARRTTCKAKKKVGSPTGHGEVAVVENLAGLVGKHRSAKLPAGLALKNRGPRQTLARSPQAVFFSEAVRAESPTFQSQGSQTDANFFLLSDLPDSAYETVESEVGEFLDDAIVDFRNNNNSDDDGYWSPKAYSI